MIIRIAAVCVFILCMGASCGHKPNDPYSKTVAAGEAEKILAAWFRCDECVNGQLRRVQELGDTAVPTLDGIFQGTVPNLPERLQIYQARCERINGHILARGLGPAENCDQYVARFEQQLIARHHDRAFEALLAIRTPDACAVIGTDYCETIPPLPIPKVRYLHTTDRSVHEPGP